MSRAFTLAFGLLISASSNASLITFYFKDDLGHTKWQHVANFSGGVLIALLSVTLIFLLYNYRASRKANKALSEIRQDLEVRVQERTATLESEINEHRATMVRLQDSQGYIKSIVDSMPLMLIGLNQDMQITQWNNASEKITGAKREQVLGKNLWEAYPTITLSREQVQEVLSTKKTSTIKHSQRGQYYFDITLYALQSNADVGIVILLEDVTKRVKAENRLIELDKMASMGELAATMALDIGTPVSRMIENLERIQQAGCGDADTQACLEVTVDDGKQASAIVNNLVDFSVNQGGQLQLASIPEILDHTIDLANEIISNAAGLKFKDIELSKNYQESVSRVPCQIAELQQVFLGIFRHACHAIGECKQENRSPLISIEVNEFYDAIWIKIHHNGRGLTADEQQNVFEPYFIDETGQQVSAPGAQRLSFAHFVVTEHHHGHMAVTSDIDVGTTFHVQLQLR